MNARTILFLLLRYELYGDDVKEKIKENISPEMLSRIYSIAKAHEVTALTAHALAELNLLGADEASVKFTKQMMIAKHQYECMQYEISEISRALTEAKIKHIFLKGSELRAYYPTPWTRTSCDIDVLVPLADVDEALSTLVSELSYVAGAKTSNDVSMHAPSKIHVELHFGLMESKTLDKGEELLDEVWERSLPKGESEYRYVMTDEMFYYHQIIHMMKHVMHGGCGIRPFVDLWVMNNRMTFDVGAREALLKSGDIEKFARSANSLSNVWLCGSEHTDITKSFENFIIYGGVYGNTVNKVSVGQSKKGGKLAYAMSRIFPPFRFMKLLYPVLEKHKWLLPFMYFRRFFRIIRKGRFSKSVAELKYNNEISAEQKEAMQTFLTDIGL
jgi:hypothetical protein